MRRAIVTGTATVSGVVLLLGLKPHSDTPLAAKGANNNFTITQSGAQGGGQPSSAPSSSSASGSSGSSGSSGTSGSSGSSGTSGSSSGSSSQPGSAPSSSASGSAPATGSKTVTGDAADTRYGPVQLAVTFSGKKITQIQVLEYPTETGRDQEINTYAIPQLNQEAMSAQSANIDGVSGATYTSEGYQQSLQSAIDKAGA
ncbi:FMN-binding protein [Catenulispora sp. NL8]|uniref:FMN-binding protein n=1 Tax=Catenulispora pinistramenti TaxID=2705254 RepID=A0ABS5KV18_9ACTN|nr:FMN-binding protein [Catenulispora pinistramenti]MBS2549906.1 FMN-binding protein [Catenulispora pinistramenti]